MFLFGHKKGSGLLYFYQKSLLKIKVRASAFDLLMGIR